MELGRGCCLAALDLARASRHRRKAQIHRRNSMRNLITSLKKLAVGTMLGAALGLFAAMPVAHAFNFPVFGPSYEGRLPGCEAGLPTITTQFWEKERKFWNSPLRITAYGNVHEKVFRPRESDNIPRRYCTAEAMVSDGKVRTVHYSIIEDGGIASMGQGVEWCVVGLDRNWAYNPGCTAAQP